MYIYFDMNIYNRVFDDQKQLRIRFETIAIDIIWELIEQEEYKLCWSFILEYENDRNPFVKRRKYISLLSKNCPEVVKANQEIKDIAAKILSSSNIKVKDSLHLACAVLKKCDYFITCDDKFIKAVNKNRNKLNNILGPVKLFNPIDFIRKEFNIDVIG